MNEKHEEMIIRIGGLAVAIFGAVAVALGYTGPGVFLLIFGTLALAFGNL